MYVIRSMESSMQSVAKNSHQELIDQASEFVNQFFLEKELKISTLSYIES